MFVQIDPTEPESWLIARAAQVLKRGGVGVIPTDTVYGLACCISQDEAIRKVYDLKGLDPKKPLSILVADLRIAGQYARGISTPNYRMMRRVLPGPYTFICRATEEVPKIMLRKRKTIGIRIPDTPIVLALLEELGEPLITTSVRTPDDQILNEPTELENRFGSKIDLLIDGGPLLPEPSTVVDITGADPVLVREGRGDVDALELVAS
jgi:tRNA threonylcarbamoyl adenosine modification protein (Sua5/YciO/YrdC/YwlC family)